MDANGKNQVDATKTPDADEDEPAWSPDGSQIAFSNQSHGEGIQPLEVFVMNADGSNPHALTSDGAQQPAQLVAQRHEDRLSNRRSATRRPRST